MTASVADINSATFVGYFTHGAFFVLGVVCPQTVHDSLSLCSVVYKWCVFLLLWQLRLLFPECKKYKCYGLTHTLLHTDHFL